MSRCPVNNPRDKSEQDYRLQYDVEYTTDLKELNDLRGVVLDVSGGAIEWNIYPGRDERSANTKCTETMCTTRETWTVGKQRGFGNGICSGTMLWSYLHQHVGAINGTMNINGETYCNSFPVHGTDPSNPPGNEKGFVVSFSSCVDKDVIGNHVRLNAGDQMEIISYYDVDKNSQATLPLPGGKHGGVMGLFFAMMDCDPGTYGEVYFCRQETCIPTFKDGTRQIRDHYQTLSDCQAKCQ